MSLENFKKPSARTLELSPIQGATGHADQCGNAHAIRRALSKTSVLRQVAQAAASMLLHRVGGRL